MRAFKTVRLWRLLLWKEMTESIRDRRTWMLTLILPIIIYPGLLLTLGKMVNGGKNKLAQKSLQVALCDSGVQALLFQTKPPAHTSWLKSDKAAAEVGLKDKKIGALLYTDPLSTPEQQRLTVEYTKRYDTSIEAKQRLVGALKEINRNLRDKRLVALHLSPLSVEPLRYDERDVDFKDWAPFIASKILPLMLLTMLLMGAFHPALDGVTGEKERGTLETLLVSPISPLEVMFAKYVSVALIATVVAISHLTVMALIFSGGSHLLPDSPAFGLELNFSQWAMLACGLSVTVLLASALAVGIAAVSRTSRQGQTLLIPFTLIGAAAGMAAMAPGLEISAGLSLVPLLNVSLWSKAVILGTASWHQLPLLCISTLGWTCLCLWGAAKAFNSESLWR